MARAADATTVLPDEDPVDLSSPQPCLRRIYSIQIRNLSPFPARDSLASVLTQRSDGASSVAGTASGIASDDADILLGQRTWRKRRISSASIYTLKSVHSDHEHDTGSLHDQVKYMRNRANSRASLHAMSNKSSSPSAKRQSHGSPADIRQRKASEASLPEDSMPLWQAVASSSSWLSGTLNSQKQLEEVIWSRLVETFLTIDLPQHDESSPVPPSPVPTSPKSQARSGKSSILKRLSSSVDFKCSALPSSSPTQRSRRTASISTSSVASSRQRTISPSRPSFNSISSSTTSQTSNSPGKATFPQSPPLTPPPATPRSSFLIPVYISPFHRPSTNPKFVLDPEVPSFAAWTDLSVDRIIIRLWAKVGTEANLSVGDTQRGKGKEKAEHIQEGVDDQAGAEWRILSEWDVCLSDLVPLPDDFVEHPRKLPANTLVLTLSPSNRLYYIPSTLLGVTPTPSRSHSPDYNSDTEVSRRRPPSKPAFSLDRERHRKQRRELKSANHNELVKLVSLQESLLDAQNHLQDVLESCNRFIQEDLNVALRRESSEREYRLECLQEQRDLLDDSIKSARDGIASRREQLRQRRIRLAEARALHEDDLLSEFDSGVRLVEEKKRVQSLRSQIGPVRTSLLSELAFIFPIELLSPPDLLYTILGVPLPIPLQGTDPAPPLSLSHLPAVSEDGVATALGYAALLVHLMAAYLCQRLVYPITYVGSRSLVKDPISAMMGPRMFPLYSKGVDTYRFEYAVFLLNKDIEMLMVERNLRALDLRHTLPNLKNLLLTLTSGEGALPRSRHLSSSSVVSITPGLQSPSPYVAEATDSGESEPPPLSLEGEDVSSSTTPKGRAVGLPSVNDDESTLGAVDTANKDANGSVITSSNATQDASDASSANEDRSGTSSGASTLRPRLPRIQIQSYLGLPLSSMWKGRGASSSSGASSSKAAGTTDTNSQEEELDLATAATDGTNLMESESDETSESSEDNDEDEEDDRRTVRGSSVPTTPIADARTRRGSVSPESLLDDLKDLKARVNLRGGNANVVSSETEKRPSSVDDREAVVDPAC